MRRSVPVLCLLLAAALAAGEENTGPLSESKQQLKQLQKDQSARDRPTSGADLKGAIPGIAAPNLQGADLPGPPAAPPPTDEKKKTGQNSTNWLLEGYDKLGAASAKGGKDSRSLRAKSSDRDNDSYDDSGWLQSAGKADAERSAREARKGGLSKSGRPTDPMEPFLKVWLANSPVKDAIFSARESSKRLERDSEMLGADFDLLRDGAPAAPANNPAGGSVDGVLTPKQENPYLQALNAPLPISATAATAPVAVTSPVMPSEGRVETPVIDTNHASAAKSNAFSGPASQAKDDKKYYPQLKRF